MKDIIEKLGINMPFDGNNGCYLYAEIGTDKIAVNMETNNLLWASHEMLEVLIEDLNKTYDDYISDRGEKLGNIEFRKYNRSRVLLVEKATNKSWEEIKDLIR